MSPATFRLVLLVSLAHAMVHTFEHSLPAVEQMIGDDFEVGKERTGGLGTIWRLPFGLGALLAGYLADRFGSKRLLIVYLLGSYLLWGSLVPFMSSLYNPFKLLIDFFCFCHFIKYFVSLVALLSFNLSIHSGFCGINCINESFLIV